MNGRNMLWFRLWLSRNAGQYVKSWTTQRPAIFPKVYNGYLRCSQQRLVPLPTLYAWYSCRNRRIVYTLENWQKMWKHLSDNYDGLLKGCSMLDAIDQKSALGKLSPVRGGRVEKRIHTVFSYSNTRNQKCLQLLQCIMEAQLRIASGLET